MTRARRGELFHSFRGPDTGGSSGSLAGSFPRFRPAGGRVPDRPPAGVLRGSSSDFSVAPAALSVAEAVDPSSGGKRLSLTLGQMKTVTAPAMTRTSKATTGPFQA